MEQNSLLTEDTKFYTLCRLCLHQEKNLVGIFEDENYNLPLKIKSCVSVEVSPMDNGPQKICEKCLYFIDNWVKFKELCENTNSILKQYLLKSCHSEPNRTMMKILAEKKIADEIPVPTPDVNFLEHDSLFENLEENETCTVSNMSSILNISCFAGNKINPDTSFKTFKTSEIIHNSHMIESYEDSKSLPVLHISSPEHELSHPLHVCSPQPELPPLERHGTGDNTNISSVLGFCFGINSQETCNFSKTHVQTASFHSFLKTALAEPLDLSKNFATSKLSDILGKTAVIPQTGKTAIIPQTGKEVMSQTNETSSANKRNVDHPKTCKNIKLSNKPNHNSNNDISAEIHHVIPTSDENVFNSKVVTKGVKVCRNPNSRKKKVLPGDKIKACNKDPPNEMPTDTFPDNCSPENAINGRAVSKRKVYKFKEYQCGICVAIFTKFNSLLKHDDECHKTINKNECCSKCNKLFISKDRLKTHESMHKEKIFKCDVCYKLFSTKRSLCIHSKRHTGKYKCTLCNYVSTHNRAIELHIEYKHNKVRTACNFCAKTFANGSALTRHMKSHNDICDRFKCVICDVRFSEANILKYHMDTHYDINHVICDKCGKSIKNKKTLENHLRRHENKRFTCVICRKKFCFRYELRLHLHTHSRIKKYVCDICKKRFKFKQTLTNHIIGTHLLTYIP